MARMSDKETLKQLGELHNLLEIRLSIWLRQPTRELMQELERTAIDHADFLGQVMGLFTDPVKLKWRSRGRPRKVDNAEA